MSRAGGPDDSLGTQSHLLQESLLAYEDMVAKAAETMAEITAAQEALDARKLQEADTALRLQKLEILVAQKNALCQQLEDQLRTIAIHGQDGARMSLKSEGDADKLLALQLTGSDVSLPPSGAAGVVSMDPVAVALTDRTLTELRHAREAAESTEKQLSRSLSCLNRGLLVATLLIVLWAARFAAEVAAQRASHAPAFL